MGGGGGGVINYLFVCCFSTLEPKLNNNNKGYL